MARMGQRTEFDCKPSEVQTVVTGIEAPPGLEGLVCAPPGLEMCRGTAFHGYSLPESLHLPRGNGASARAREEEDILRMLRAASWRMEHAFHDDAEPAKSPSIQEKCTFNKTERITGASAFSGSGRKSNISKSRATANANANLPTNANVHAKVCANEAGSFGPVPCVAASHMWAPHMMHPSRAQHAQHQAWAQQQLAQHQAIMAARSAGWAAGAAAAAAAFPPGSWDCTAKRSRFASPNASTTASLGAASSSDGEQDDAISTVDDAKLEKANARQMRVERTDDASLGSGGLSVCWPVDAHKLCGNDKQIVSPRFEIFPGVACRLMIKATEMGNKKGQSCFKKSKGRGSIEFKCEAEASADISPISFSVSIGEQPARGPVVHDFTHGYVCGLPRNDKEFDFRSAVDRDSQLFIVKLEVAPQSS